MEPVPPFDSQVHGVLQPQKQQCTESGQEEEKRLFSLG